jgi:predicted nucleic acid-binding protein
MRNAVVVDTSVVVKWILDEPDSKIALALLTEWTDKEIDILAPALLAYEITNVLYQRVHRDEMSLAKAKQALAKVMLSELELDFSQDPALSTQAMELAHRFNLPATYDAHYLAMAEREGCELWTADKRMWNTIRGKLAWVRWMEDYRPTSTPTEL